MDQLLDLLRTGAHPYFFEDKLFKEECDLVLVDGVFPASLRRVDLSVTGIDHCSFQDLLNNAPNLSAINLDGTDVTCMGVGDIGEGCPNLQRLVLPMSDDIDDVCIQGVIAGCKRLSYLDTNFSQGLLNQPPVHSTSDEDVSKLSDWNDVFDDHECVLEIRLAEPHLWPIKHRNLKVTQCLPWYQGGDGFDNDYVMP